ncbi:twin-arginine translocase TatA/TatE family subunit [Deinococcus malanensis]|uniref:Sec-independent protein translocase subunit TatA/TatB n=1 Tax=Deinococcus malanensis TaxID=1706855 RepID=UPI001E3B7F1D|nr:twin-arginine translocase TatA/TatE family subunit [Deinococcus malanensis]
MDIGLIALVATLVFGPRKIPELGRSLGQGIREFRRGTLDLKRDLALTVTDDQRVRNGPV